MEEQYELWKRKTIERRASASSGSAATLGGDTLAEAHQRLSYEDFKSEIMQGNDGGELLNYVNTHVIFQAGVDFESRPMLVFCACNLPNPQTVDYDRLLNLIIFRLDEFVENDYTVVLFTSGAKFNPGWNWLSKAYKRLDRNYRKNVKSVYVVHPSLWSKLLFQIVGRIVSPKFFAKVTWVDTLSRLAMFVPLGQINIPQPVYDYNLTVEQAIKMPSPEHEILATQIFGVPLDTLMQDNTGLLPQPVRECISFIRYNGLTTEGLFRRSPPSTALRAAKDMYNRGHNVDLSLSGVHVAAVLLKLFFRELPSPVFGSTSYETILALPSVQRETDSEPDSEVTEVARQMDTVRARYVEEVVLPSLTFEYRQLLCFTCALLTVIARNKEINRMSAYNLAVVWAPNLARSANPVVDVAMCSAGPHSSTVGSVIQIFIQFFDSVFDAEIEMILGKERKAMSADLATEMLNVVDSMNRTANLAHVNQTSVFDYLQEAETSPVPPALPTRHGVPPPVPPKVPPRVPARHVAESVAPPPVVPPKDEVVSGVDVAAAAPEDIVAAALSANAADVAASEDASEAAVPPVSVLESPKEEVTKPEEPKEPKEPEEEEQKSEEPVVEKDVAEDKNAEEDAAGEIFKEASSELASSEAGPVDTLADDLAETGIQDSKKEDAEPAEVATDDKAGEEETVPEAVPEANAAPSGGKKKKVLKKKRANQVGSSAN